MRKLIVVWGKITKSASYRVEKGQPRPANTYRAARRNNYFRPVLDGR